MSFYAVDFLTFAVGSQKIIQQFYKTVQLYRELFTF